MYKYKIMTIMQWIQILFYIKVVIEIETFACIKTSAVGLKFSVIWFNVKFTVQQIYCANI